MSTFCSIRHRLIFVHVPKCAGTTINIAILRAINGGKPSPEFRLIGQGSHPFAKVVRELVGKKSWANCWKFGVVRNPWERMVSLYAFLRERELIESDVTFRSWLLDGSNAHKKAVPQSYWLCDDGRQIVNTVFRFERLDSVRSALSAHLGQPIRLGRYRKTAHGDYRGYYDGDMEAWVGEVHAEDIERFGYEF